VRVEQPLEVVLDGAEAPAPEVPIFAGIADVQAIRLAMLLPDRGRGGGEERVSQLRADAVARDIAQPGKAPDREAAEGLRSRVHAQNGGGHRAAEVGDVAPELREPQVEQAMQLSDAVPDVLHEAVAQVDELAQLVGGPVGEGRGGGLFLPAELGRAQSVDGVRLGPPQVFFGKALGPQGVHHGDPEPSDGESGHQILPVVARGLQDDEGIRGRAQQIAQARVTSGVLRDRGDRTY
jgi:hypothetical protein